MDEGTIKAATEFVKAVGTPAAILIVGLGLFVLGARVMWRQIAELGKRIGVVEDARISDLKTVIMPHTTAMNALAASNGRLATAIENSPCGRAAGAWLKGETARTEREGELGFARPMACRTALEIGNVEEAK
jgi:hypothetical protein